MNGRSQQPRTVSRRCRVLRRAETAGGSGAGRAGTEECLHEQEASAPTTARGREPAGRIGAQACASCLTEYTTAASGSGSGRAGREQEAGGSGRSAAEAGASRFARGRRRIWRLPPRVGKAADLTARRSSVASRRRAGPTTARGEGGRPDRRRGRRVALHEGDGGRSGGRSSEPARRELQAGGSDHRARGRRPAGPQRMPAWRGAQPG